MSIRAKMQLEAVVHAKYGSIKALFRCIYDQTKWEEDKAFQKATPTGTAEFQIDNPAVFPQLVIGKNYYFDISPAE